jgi:hypothetical protein
MLVMLGRSYGSRSRSSIAKNDSEITIKLVYILPDYTV